MAEKCAYKGCSNPRNVQGDSWAREPFVQKRVVAERTGVFGFSTPVRHLGNMICRVCRSRRKRGQARVRDAANHVRPEDVLAQLEKDIRELEARKDRSPGDQAELDGYLYVAQRTLKEPEEQEN